MGTFPMNTIGRASVSMLRTWLVKISPEIGDPSGSTTLVPKGLTREVIGQTTANSVTWQNSPGETTRAGRRPLCSRPTRGSKSVQIRSPASGAYRSRHYSTTSRPFSGPQSNASRIASGVIPFSRSAKT